MENEPINLFTPDNSFDPYHVDDHIINGKQAKWKKVLGIIASVIGWLYIVVYIVYVVYGLIATHFNLPLLEIWLYNRAMLEETEKLFLILAIGACIITLYLMIWKTYNFRVFGKKDRRKFPKDVTDEDLAEYFELRVEDVRIAKTLKVIEFPDNVV